MELEINETNFDQYFFDIRQNNIQRGQVIAVYTAIAEFVDGPEKKQMIALLSETDKVIPATHIMRKLLFASELDSYKIPQQILEDLLSGMSVDEVAAKPYKYTLEMYFYTKPEYVPKNDRHWSIISVMNLDEFLDRKDGITTRLLSTEESAKITEKMGEFTPELLPETEF